MKMSDDYFVELAMKVVAQQATPAEQKELDELIVIRPELRTDLEQLRNAARLAKEALPLVNAIEATEAGKPNDPGVRHQSESLLADLQLGADSDATHGSPQREDVVYSRVASRGGFPGYARGRLQSKVRETYGAPQMPEKEETKEAFWSWRWLLGLATATAVLALIVFPSLLPKPRVSVQVAMLDLAGTSRGADTNEVALLRQAWQDAPFENFSKATKLEDWEKSWPLDAKGTVAKIIYDRSVGEVRVVGRHKGQPFQKSFVVEKDLPGTLKAAAGFVREQARK